MTPLEILGLDPGAEEQAIKRAYAKLLKVHRPDQDPEGFRRIRDAYEQAIEQLSWGNIFEPPSPVLPIDPAASTGPIIEFDEPPPPEFPAELIFAIEEDDPAQGVPLIKELIEAYVEAPGQTVDAYEIIERMPGHWSDEVVREISVRHLMAELENGRNTLTQWTTDHWLFSLEYTKLTEIARAWLQEQDRRESEENLVIGRDLATKMSLFDNTLAKKIAQACDDRSPYHEESFREDQLDYFLLIGASLRTEPEEVRIFWSNALLNIFPYDWSRGQAKSRLKAIEKAPNAASITPIIYQQLGFDPQSKRRIKPMLTDGLSGNWWWKLWLIAILLRLFFQNVSCDREPTTQAPPFELIEGESDEDRQQRLIRHYEKMRGEGEIVGPESLEAFLKERKEAAEKGKE